MGGSLLYGANIQANGIRQHYLRFGGQGRPLLILPGITSPAMSWGFVAEALATDHDVYVLDIRGRGLSETGDALDYSLDAMAADVPPLIEALGLKDVLVVGHSMGARIILRACHRSGLSVAGAILADPPMSGPGRRAYPAKLDWYVDSIRLANRGITLEEMRSFSPTFSEDQLRLRAEWLHTCHEGAVVTAFNGFHTDDILPDIASLPAQSMLMVAGRGGVVQAEDIAALVTSKPDLKVAYVPDAGHMIPWDDLSSFVGLVRNFSSSL